MAAKKQSARKEAQDKQNLAKGNRFKSGDEATKRAGSKGGKKSQAIQRRRRNMAADIKALLSMPIESAVLDSLEDLKALPELEGSNVTAQELMLYQLILKGIGGDRESIKLIYEMTGDEREQADDNDAVLKFLRAMTE